MDKYGASAEDNKPVMVQATVTSVHDRLPPYEGHNIVVVEHYTFRLTGGSKVEEEWSNRPVATESGAIDIGGFSGAGSSALGEGGQHVAW
jgi:predicted secreted hydrolase